MLPDQFHQIVFKNRKLLLDLGLLRYDLSPLAVFFDDVCQFLDCYLRQNLNFTRGSKTYQQIL